jgi:predicted dinucleotide-binding enzyme
VRVGIVGSGRIGATAARLLVAAGHEVAIANSRGPESLGPLVAELGHGARAATVEEAGRFGEVVLVAIPFHAAEHLPAEAFAGKVVVDANNYFGGRDGTVEELEDARATSSELLAQHLAGAEVVKAFNTIHFQTLASEGRTDLPREQRLVIPLAADDEAAKRQVAELIEEIGFAALDTGTLADGGRLQQPGGPFFNRPMLFQEAERELAARRA